jgi:hypothetical protein
MASPIDTIMSGSLEGLSLAGFETWITLGINIILSTIVGGAVLAFVALVIGKKYNEEVNAGSAFLMSLVVNAINFFGIIGILGSFAPAITMFLPLLVWIALSKFFFSGMKFTHTLVIGVLGYLLTIFVVPSLAASLVTLLPL